MRKFYSGVVNRSKFILILFIILAALSMLLQGNVKVNYDINDYVPPETHSTVSLEVMQQEFSGSIPNARVMLKDVSIPEAMEYKEAICAVDGVLEVLWLDNTVDITTPSSMLNSAEVETYYKNQCALFNVTIDDNMSLAAVEEIRAIIGPDNAMTGSAVSSALATSTTVTEIKTISIIAVILVFIILILTTSSWCAPIIILIGLGVAILLNNGSHLIFGEVSFVTNAAGSILQLAVSLDYSVFLIHRFEECRKTAANPKEAMVDALCKSTSSIFSSGLTTIIGFLALVLMKFQIGPDLGLALAKGICISLVTVFLFMPSLILTTYNLLDKTRHRNFMPSFKKLGRLVTRIALPVVIVFVILIVPSYLGSNANAYHYGSAFIFGEKTAYGHDNIEIESIFGKNDTYILLVPKGNDAAEIRLSKDLHALPEVTSIISYVDTVGPEIPTEYLDEGTLGLLQSDNYRRFVISVNTEYEGDATFALVEQIRAIADSHYPASAYLAGEGVSTYDLMDTITADMVKVNLLAIGAIFVVLLITMRSLFVPIILVLSIETAIWINLAVPYFMDNPIFYIAYLIISSVQLGATVDYAILLTQRYKENRALLAKKAAMEKTISDVTVSILTSGSALTIVGLLLGYISTNGILAQLGIFIGRGALCTLPIILLALPGLLLVFDKFVIRKKTAPNTQEVANHETI